MDTSQDESGRQPPADDLDLLTPDQVADMLGVKRRTLVDWAQKRVGPPFISIGAGRRTRYRRSDVAAYIEAQRVDTAEVAS